MKDKTIKLTKDVDRMKKKTFLNKTLQGYTIKQKKKKKKEELDIKIKIFSS